MRLLQHVPTFVDGYEPKLATGTLGEILATPWVARWLDACEEARFVRSDHRLLVEGTQDGKRWWWVVGFFDEVPHELPQWVYPNGPTGESGAAAGREANPNLAK